MVSRDPVEGRVSVVLATRDRPEGAARAVASILSSPALLELVVVDQSADGRTRQALAPLASDDRLTVSRDEGVGLSRARNLGWRSTRSEWVAFTDDDCEACPGWLEGLSAAFSGGDRIGVVFGGVGAPDYDRSRGFVMAHTARPFRVARHIGEKARVEGVGACMAVRRSVLEALDGFDEELGAGAPLRSGEDTDLCLRALIAGFHACETPDARVRHHGFHAWGEAEDVIHGYMLGLGACQAKLLRLARLRALPSMVALGGRWLFGEPVVDLNHRPPRGARLRSFGSGFRTAWSTPLDSRGHLAPQGNRAGR